MNMIDWEAMRAAYNEHYGLDLQTEEEFIKHAYIKGGKNYKRASEILGISDPTFKLKMVEHGIKRQERFGNPKRKYTCKQWLKKIGPEKLENLTLRQISDFTKFRYQTVQQNMRRLGYKYKPVFDTKSKECTKS